jgi:hypothetical protein
MKNEQSLFQFLGRFNDRSALLVLFLLLSADSVFISINGIIDLSPTLRRENLYFFSISEDRSYPEIFQYLKWLWITILLINISRSKRSVAYLAWGLLTTYLLFDDCIGIHELLGAKIAAVLNFTSPLSMRPQDGGELIVSAIAAVVLLSLIAWSYLRGAPEFKKFSQDMILLMAGLFFFGVFIDALVYVLPIGEKMIMIMGFLEDSAEMFIASLLLWYVFQSSIQEKAGSTFLSDFFRIKMRIT